MEFIKLIQEWNTLIENLNEKLFGSFDELKLRVSYILSGEKESFRDWKGSNKIAMFINYLRDNNPKKLKDLGQVFVAMGHLEAKRIIRESSFNELFF